MLPPINIHPMVVHFPIALLTTYTVLELLRFSFFTRQPYWFYLKATLVILGTLSGYAAIVAGKMAKELISNPEVLKIVERHQIFAVGSILIFTIISIYYARAWYKQQTSSNSKIILFLSILGLLGIMITGALGGSVVYGPTNDPVTEWIYNLFIK